MPLTPRRIVASAALCVLPSAVHALVIQVPSQQPTIQAAIAASANGDTVLVAPGTYVENINFHGKAIKVVSQSGAATTTIDGNQADSVVTFAMGEGSASELSGFTVRNGKALGQPNFGGGGIRISGSLPTIQGNVITENQACWGGGIAVDFGSPAIKMNTIARNTQGGCSSGNGGGGIRIGGASSAQILNNVITENVVGSGGGGIEIFAGGTPIIRNNFINKNMAGGCGGGIGQIGPSDAVIVGNVVTNNTAPCGGGVSWSIPFGAKGPLVLNNTITENDAPLGSGILAEGFDEQTEAINNVVIGKVDQTVIFCGTLPSTPIFRFNNVWSPQGLPYGGICTDQTGLQGNISANPLFVAPAQGNFRLNPDSPSIDTGDNAAPSLPPTDIAGANRIVDGDSNGSAVVDMGAYEFGPNPGTLQFSAASYGALETSGQLQVVVTRRGGKTGHVTVDFGAAGGTATPGSDFNLSAGTVTFSDGDIADKTFKVTIFDDTLPEPAETVALQLVNPTGGATLGPLSTAAVTIVDDELIADLALMMSDSPDPVLITGKFTYTLTITNHGPFPATGVILADPLPVTVGSATATASQGTCTGVATITCALGTLAAGATATVMITVTASSSGVISNVAMVSGTEPDPNVNNNSATQTTTVSPTIPSASYFPITPGMTWTYQGNTGYTVTVLPAMVSVNGILTSVFAQSDGQQDFYTNDANGIRQHRQFLPNVTTAVGVVDITLTFIPPIQIVKAQATGGEGAFSSGIAQTNPLPEVGVLTIPYDADFHVIRQESVSVPAGTFNALPVHGTLRLDQEISSQTTYIAQGVGIIKEVTNTETTVLTAFTAPLAVTKAGNGSGTVTSSPGGINCGGICQAFFTSGTEVILTPVPGPGMTFNSWSGDPDCSDGQVTMDMAKTCTRHSSLNRMGAAARIHPLWKV